jgi:hypothetical protein
VAAHIALDYNINNRNQTERYKPDDASVSMSRITNDFVSDEKSASTTK